MKKDIVIVLGMHGSGKTTIGKFLNSIGFSYFEEIGTDLRKTCSCTVLDSCYLFDREIMLKEIERDQLLLSQERTPVIETWHIGNIAFSSIRKNTEIVKEYENRFKNQLKKFNPTILLISISDEVFIKRASEKGIKNKQKLLTFYKHVFEEEKRIIENYRFPVLEITGDKKISELKETLLLNLKRNK